MEVGVRLWLCAICFSYVVSAQLFAPCSASFETACSVAAVYNLVVRMYTAFQNANRSQFEAYAAEINQGAGQFVQTGTSSDLYGFLWFTNGTCAGHPYVCRNGSQSMQEYVARNSVITTPYLDKLISATAYYAGGPQPAQTRGIGAWLFYYWQNELKRSFFLPVTPVWTNDTYLVGAGFNDVAAAGANLQSPTQCTPHTFALCASDLAQQLAQEFRMRILRQTSQMGLFQFFANVTGREEGTRVNGMFHGDIYGILQEGDNVSATALAHSNVSQVGQNIIGGLRADNDTIVWERFSTAALGHKFGAWVQYPARSDNGTWVERFAFCLHVAANINFIAPYSSLLVVSYFDRIYDARASFSILKRETSGVVWVNTQVSWLLTVNNERKDEQYEPGDVDRFLGTGIRVVFTGGVIQPIVRLPDGRFRLAIQVNSVGPHLLTVYVQERYQNQNITAMKIVGDGNPIKIYVYDPTNRLVLSEGWGYAFFGWTVFTALIILGFMGWTVANLKTRIVFASSADFMMLTAVGLLLTLVSVMIDIVTPDSITCDFQLSLWFQHLGSVLAEAAMVVKAYRLHRIFNNAKLQKVVLPRPHLYGVVGLAISVQMVFLSIATFVYPSKLGPFGSEDVECIVNPDPGFLGIKAAMLIVEAVPVLAAAGLAYKLQDIPIRYNESKWLGLACMNWVIVVIFYVVTFFAHVNAFVAQLFMCFCVVWVSFCTALLLFVPKIIQLHHSPAPPKGSQLSVVSAGLEARLLPESIMDTIKARETALTLARGAQTRALAKLHSAEEAVKKCEAQLFDSVAELAFQNQGRNDAWKMIEDYRQARINPRASINEEGT